MKPDTLRAGAAAVDITPQSERMMLAGYFERRYSTSVLDALHARAVVIEGGGAPKAGGSRLIFVLVDLIALPEQDTDPLRKEISRLAEVPVDCVCISCTHTHYAPATRDGFETLRESRYVEWASRRIIESVQQALSRLEPARVAWGNGQEPRPQYNRRYHMRGGGVRMNPGFGNPDTIRPAGPTDPQVPMLLIESTAGKPIAAIANYSLHYIGDFDKNLVSSDYFGRFSDIMRQRHGDDFVALLTHGASGDINNVNAMQRPEPWYPEPMAPTERSQIIAGMIADQVDHVWQSAQWHDAARVAATEDIYRMGVRKISGAEIEQAERERDDGNLSAVERSYARGRLELLEETDEVPKIVQSLRVGDWAASTMTGEIFCQLGLDLKHASPFGTTALIELANGHSGYVATRYSYELGGYETRLSRNVFAKPGSGEEMVALAASQLQRLAQTDAYS